VLFALHHSLNFKKVLTSNTPWKTMWNSHQHLQ